VTRHRPPLLLGLMLVSVLGLAGAEEPVPVKPPDRTGLVEGSGHEEWRQPDGIDPTGRHRRCGTREITAAEE
jgi:hypothetical protein